MKKPIKRRTTKAAPRKRTTMQYETVGDMLAARHMREHGSYPMWHGRQLKHTC